MWLVKTNTFFKLHPQSDDCIIIDWGKGEQYNPGISVFKGIKYDLTQEKAAKTDKVTKATGIIIKVHLMPGYNIFSIEVVMICGANS